SRVLNATDPLPSLAGKCVTGGRLNLRKALLSPPITLTALPQSGPFFRLRLSGGPSQTCVIQMSTNFAPANWTSLFTNTTSTNGTFIYTDTKSTNSVHRMYRGVSAP